MNKQEWFNCKDLNKLIKQATSKRKRQLFALACCRSIEHLMQDQRSKDCLEKIELFIDGNISEKEFELTRQAAWYAVRAVASAGWAVASAANIALAACWANAESVVYWSYWATANNERFKQLEILKDIYNPYLDNLKFSDLAISLASQVYEGDDSARGVLSDCLEEEGYTDEIVKHLKSGVHYKGCWLIDQILEKS